MKKLEREILLKAFDNHKLECREPVHWRVCIKAYLNQLPVEATAEKNFINGIDESTWLTFSNETSAYKAATLAYQRLAQYVKSHHVENVESSRTNTISGEVFFKLGYVYIASKKLHTKAEAISLMEKWKDKGLTCFIMPELPEGADLYTSEVLALTKYADLVKTSHIVPRGHIGRIPGSVESVLVGEKEDIIQQAKKTVDSAFQALEKAGLAIRIRGFNLCFTWSGITLNREGVATAQKIKEEAYQEYLSEQAARAEKQCNIKCLNCGEIFLRTKSLLFRSDCATTGNMIEFLPHLAQAGYSVSFGPNDCGDAIMCPGCGEGLIDPGSFRFKEGVLIPEEVEAV